jgi:hypothetical protein
MDGADPVARMAVRCIGLPPLMSAEGVNLAIAIAPTATSISVLETLGKLDGDFGAVATAVENGEFALWVGSGISRQAPSLGGLIVRAVEHLRQKAIDPSTRPRFDSAFQAALRLAGWPPQPHRSTLRNHSTLGRTGAQSSVYSGTDIRGYSISGSSTNPLTTYSGRRSTSATPSVSVRGLPESFESVGHGCRDRLNRLDRL